MNLVRGRGGNRHKCLDRGMDVLGGIEESLESLLVVGPLGFGFYCTEANAIF